MGEIKVKVGDAIPLQAQETNKDATKVVRATLYDLDDFTVLAGAGSILLAHQFNGAYFDDSYAFPTGVDKVYAQYLVFDSDGTTPNTTGEQAVNDIFVRDDLGDAIGDLQNAVKGSDLVATIDDPAALSAILTQGEELTAVVDEPALVATISEPQTLGASIDDPETLKGEIEC